MHGLIFETSVWLLAESTRLLSFVPQAFLDCKDICNIVLHFRPIQTKPLHFREGIVNVTCPDSQVLHHHQLSNFPEPVVGQVDTEKTTSRFSCQERPFAFSSTQGNDWCFLRPIWTNPRHRCTTTTTHSHSQNQPYLGPIRLDTCTIWVTHQFRSCLDHGKINERYRKDYMHNGTKHSVHATWKPLQTIARSYQSAKLSDLEYCYA